MVELCFKVELGEGYKASIRDFEKRYRELGISITPKVFHVGKIELNVNFYIPRFTWCSHTLKIS